MVSISTLDTLVESIITCPICLKHFDQPRLLSPCRDTFCSKCIEQMAVDNGGVMQCLKPDGGQVEIDGINDLYFNNDIIKLMNIFKFSSMAEIPCDRCVEKPAEYWCDHDCRRSFCSLCWDDIHGKGQYRNHRKLPASERPEKVAQCYRHETVDRSLTYWCKTCSEAICADCQRANHAGHESISVDQYTKSLQIKIANSLEAIQSCLTYRRNRADQYVNEVNQEYETNRKKVEETMSRLQRSIDPGKEGSLGAIEVGKCAEQEILKKYHNRLNEEQQKLIGEVLNFVKVKNEKNLQKLLDIRQPINEYIERTHEKLIDLKPLNRRKKHLSGLDTIPPDLGLNITLANAPIQEKEQVKQRIMASAGKKELDLSNLKLNCFDMELVAKVLEINRGLEKLQLFKNEISDMGAQYLADGLRQNNTLIELELYDNQISSTGLKHLADALRTNRKLKKLTMYRNKIDDNAAEMIADTLKNNEVMQPQIRKINFIPTPPTPIPPPPMPNPRLEALIAQCLRSDYLDWGRKNYNNDDIRIIAEKLLKNNTALKDLRLYNNQIGDCGAQQLADVLRTNRTLTRLDLYTNKIGDIGAQHLADALSTNQTLTVLYLNANQIGDVGAQHFAYVLRINQTLKTLHLPSRISQNVRTQLKQASNGRVSLNYSG